MSVESILKHILDEARAEKEKMLQQAIEERTVLMQEAKKETERLYRENIEKEAALLERQKQGLIVHARLESKKHLLQTKQELIAAAFAKLKTTLKKDKFKKQQVSPDKTCEVNEDIDFYLKKIRPDYETEIAGILFV